MDQEILSNSLKYAIRISHTEEGWIPPLLDAVKDVDFETARWKPGPDVASIWEITAHAIPYTESRVCDLTGEPYPNEVDWPAVDSESEPAWSALKARVESVVSRLQAAVEAQSPEGLAAVAPGRESLRSDRLIDIVVHDAYHAGQIVKLTQIAKSRSKGFDRSDGRSDRSCAISALA